MSIIYGIGAPGIFPNAILAAGGGVAGARPCPPFWTSGAGAELLELLASLPRWTRESVVGETALRRSRKTVV